MRYCIHNIYQSLTRKCQMLINILIMSPDTHSLTDLNLLITHSLNTGKDMTQVWRWITRLLCVWVCIKTCEVSVRLLMTAPVLQGRRGLMTMETVTPDRDHWTWPVRDSRITSGEARVTAEQSGINSRMTVRVTPGEPLLMAAILRLICLTAATAVHTAAAF